VCPLIGSEIHDALGKLGAQASKLNVVGISVDPRGDTRPAVKRWLAVHHEPANFHYLIGSAHELAPVWKAFYVSPQTPRDPRSTHTAVIWLINRRGRLAALVPAGIPIDTSDLAHDLGVLLAKT
jgi:protein SCO1/2